MHFNIHLLLTLAAAAGTTFVGAQDASSAGALAAFGPLITGLSANCTTAFAALLSTPSNPLSTCLSIPTFFGGLTQLGSNASLAPLLDSYLGGQLCPTAPCSAQVISAANTSLNAACTDADRALNAGGNVAGLFRTILNDYFQIKDAACLSDSNNGDNCIVQAAHNFQHTTNANLSLTTVIGLLSGNNATLTAVSAFIANKTDLCTDCNKGIVAAVFKSLGVSPQTALASLATSANTTSSSPSLVSSLVSGINQQCSASFFTDSLPTDVKNASAVSISTTSSSSTSTSNGASSGRGVQSSSAVAGVMALAGLVAAGFMLVA